MLCAYNLVAAEDDHASGKDGSHVHSKSNDEVPKLENFRERRVDSTKALQYLVCKDGEGHTGDFERQNWIDGFHDPAHENVAIVSTTV